MALILSSITDILLGGNPAMSFQPNDHGHRSRSRYSQKGDQENDDGIKMTGDVDDVLMMKEMCS